MARFPIELEMEGRTVLVVGLGTVGRRKAAALAEAGAQVVGVDPAPATPGELPPALEVRREPYRPEHLSGMGLVIAAGPPGLNLQVVADARRAGLWACSASDPAGGDFAVPASRRSGPLIVTVSTSGASPALAAALCDRAAAALGEGAPGLAGLLAELRPLAMSSLLDPAARRRILREWADPRWLDLWTTAGPDAVRSELLRRIREVS